MKVSKLAENLIGSEIVKIGNEVNDLKANGAKIANLTIGDLNSQLYSIPELLQQEIEKAYQNHQTNYPPADGVLTLRKAISKDIEKRWQLDYTTNDILIAAGARPLIYSIYKTIVDPGDKVIYPIPSWNNNHYSYLSSAQSIEVITKVENNFLPTAEELKPYISDAVLISLCSPLNPTGTMFTKEQLYDICEMIVEENKRRAENQKPLYLLFDQIYSNLTFDHEHITPVSLFPEMKDYTIFVDGISKSLAATGVRVGWSFGPTEIISKMKALNTHIGSWAPKPEQEATGNYYQNTESLNAFIGTFSSKLQNSLRVLHKGIQGFKTKGLLVDSIQPMGAMYLTIKMDYLGKTTVEGQILNTSSDLVFYLIHEAGVALVPFSAFGCSVDEPWFRASVGGISEEELTEMLPQLEQALLKLK